MNYDSYKRLESLGKGGNGRVIVIEDEEGKQFALKIVTAKKGPRLERFILEARKMHELYNEGQKGIIPVIAYQLPSEQTNEYSYLMPIATPLKAVDPFPLDIYERVLIFKQLASILSELHFKGISHRDIKPENILFYDNEYCFSDFGLVDFPEKPEMTQDWESVGNKKTIAPEMRQAIEVEDARPADVYSFAKTLWMILTDEIYAFDGQFNPFENTKLQEKYPDKHLVELYELLKDSTFENPKKRPSIEEFLIRLTTWENISKSSTRSNLSKWNFINNSIINNTTPYSLSWKDKTQVVQILNQLCTLGFNHTFIPSGGGMDLLNAHDFNEFSNLDSDQDHIIINFGTFSSLQVMKVNKLTLNTVNKDPLFSYFRLEFENIDPIFPQYVSETDAYLQKHYPDSPPELNEDLVIYEDQYIQDFEDDSPGRNVSRWFRKGSFLIVSKSSIYNTQISKAYDSRHNKLSEEQFSEYMEMLQKVFRHRILKPYFQEIAQEDPCEENFFTELRYLLKLSDEDLQCFLNEG